MCKRGDGLHLDRVHLLERVVEHSRRVDDLPPEVLVVHVADEERLGREGVGLDVDVGAGDLVDERRLADVGVAADEERAGGRVDLRETRHVLSDLLEVCQGVLLALHDRRHAAERRLLQLLAAVQRVTELDQAAVVLADLNDEVARSVQLAESELVVVLVVEDVKERVEEGVEVLRGDKAGLAARQVHERRARTHVHNRELGQDLVKPLLERRLGELDLAHVCRALEVSSIRSSSSILARTERPDTADLEA